MPRFCQACAATEVAHLRRAIKNFRRAVGEKRAGDTLWKTWSNLRRSLQTKPQLSMLTNSSLDAKFPLKSAEFRSAKSTLCLSSLLVLVYIVSWILMTVAVNDTRISVSSSSGRPKRAEGLLASAKEWPARLGASQSRARLQARVLFKQKAHRAFALSSRRSEADARPLEHWTGASCSAAQSNLLIAIIAIDWPKREASERAEKLAPGRADEAIRLISFLARLPACSRALARARELTCLLQQDDKEGGGGGGKAEAERDERGGFCLFCLR